MSDRCYMELTCRREDAQQFEALGFTAQSWNNQPDSFLVVMTDEEANYAHDGEMPGKIPYHGFNGSGGNFGQGSFACDGRTYADVETGHNGGFVVDWDEKKNRPSARSLRTIRRYLKIRDRVRKSFEKMKPKSP